MANPRIFNAHDIERIRGFLSLATESEASRYHTLMELKKELEYAQVVPPQEVPADVVTMNSEVRIEGESTEGSGVVKLVFPQDADYTRGRISLLAPLGAALLGRRKGETVRYPAPGGQVEVTVHDIVYQPEAAGDLTL